jgi:hypothetical protein
MKWEYESEGYKLSDGTYYLPDFYLPETRCFAEVKGIMYDEDMHKIKQFQEDTGWNMVICYSDMTFQASDCWGRESKEDGSHDNFTLTEKESSLFGKCFHCGKYYFMGINGAYICTNCGDYDGGHTTYSIAWRGNSKGGVPEWGSFWDLNPLNRAKRARFEHGERG